MLQLVLDTEDITEMRRQTSNRVAKYESQHLDVPIIIVTSEIDPWSKTGGLALVASSFAYEFASRGHRTMVVTLMYDQYKNVEHMGCRHFHFDNQSHQADYF